MDLGSIEAFEEGQVVFQEGDPADRMYILLDGAVELKKRVEKGETVLKTVRKPNDFFGEMALIDGKPRSASAIAIKATSLMRVDRSTFEKMIRNNGDFAVKIIMVLSDRIRHSNLHLTEILDLSPRERICRGIADFSLRFGDKASGDARYIRYEAMKDWVNGHIGVSREEVEAQVFRMIGSREITYFDRDRQYLMVSGDYLRAYDRRRASVTH